MGVGALRSDDKKLIQEFLQGEPGAIETIDAWIAQAASSFRMKLQAEWEDLLQDSRLELTRLLSQNKFRGEASLRTYLWRVVNHACIDKVRARTKRQWTELDDPEHPTLPRQLVEPSGLQNHESEDLLLRVLAKSSEDCRKLWRMVLEGWSYREMSLRLKVSEGALRVRVLRCRKHAVKVRDQLLAKNVGELESH